LKRDVVPKLVDDETPDDDAANAVDSLGVFIPPCHRVAGTRRDDVHCMTLTDLLREQTARVLRS
jgi:hypothetical protein